MESSLSTPTQLNDEGYASHMKSTLDYSLNHGPGCHYFCMCGYSEMDIDDEIEEIVSLEQVMNIPERELIGYKCRCGNDNDSDSPWDLEQPLYDCNFNSLSPEFNINEEIATYLRSDSDVDEVSDSDNGPFFDPIRHSQSEREPVTDHLGNGTPFKNPTANQLARATRLQSIVENRFYGAKLAGVLLPAPGNPSWSSHQIQIVEEMLSKRDLVHSNFNCDLCLTRFEPEDKLNIEMKCGHIFHGDCLVFWLKASFSCFKCFREIGHQSNLLFE